MRDFHGSVDITDPCYDRDVTCRLNDVKIKPGEYQCLASHDYSEAHDYLGNPYKVDHIRLIGIYHNGVIPRRRDMRVFDGIGVDAGLAGFFHNKPDYNDEAWSKFCDNLCASSSAYLDDAGFYSSSGFGDGYYPVYAHRDEAGEIDALEIRFF